MKAFNLRSQGTCRPRGLLPIPGFVYDDDGSGSPELNSVRSLHCRAPPVDFQMSGLVYPISARLVWGGGWLQQMGFVDFAGHGRGETM